MTVAKKVGGEQGNISSDKLLKIIECLAANHLPCRLTDLAEKLEIPQSTVLRYLRTLNTLGYVFHDADSGCYGLTWKLCGLCDDIKANSALRAMASPFLNKLAGQLNMGILLATEHNGEVLYLDMVGNICNITGTLLRIGKNVPMHTTGSGKILLSAMPERRLNSIIEMNGLEKLTEKAISSKEALLKELETICRRGYALDDEESEPGHRCVSVPLYDYTGNVSAAISAFDNTDMMTTERILNEVVPALLSAADAISFRMGYSKPVVETPPAKTVRRKAAKG